LLAQVVLGFVGKYAERGSGRVERLIKSHRIMGRLLLLTSFAQMYFGIEELRRKNLVSDSGFASLAYAFGSWLFILSCVFVRLEMWLRMRDEVALRVRPIPSSSFPPSLISPPFLPRLAWLLPSPVTLRRPLALTLSDKTEIRLIQGELSSSAPKLGRLFIRQSDGRCAVAAGMPGTSACLHTGEFLLLSLRQRGRRVTTQLDSLHSHLPPKSSQAE
jgi:hypothetical protein